MSDEQKAEVISSGDLKTIAQPNAINDNTKGMTNLVKEVRGAVADFVGLFQGYKQLQGLVNPAKVDTQKDVNVKTKIEKGINQNIPEKKEPKIAVHLGNALTDLNKLIEQFVTDEKTGKQIKEELKAMPDDVITKFLGDFIQKHTEVYYE